MKEKIVERKLMSIVHVYDCSTIGSDETSWRIEASLDEVIENALESHVTMDDHVRIENISCCMTSIDKMIHTIIVSYDEEKEIEVLS